MAMRSFEIKDLVLDRRPSQFFLSASRKASPPRVSRPPVRRMAVTKPSNASGCPAAQVCKVFFLLRLEQITQHIRNQQYPTQNRNDQRSNHPAPEPGQRSLPAWNRWLNPWI